MTPSRTDMTPQLFSGAPAEMARALTKVLGVVTFGSLTGSMLPFVFRRLGFEPASASAPFVATLRPFLLPS